jgi:hypothetical protein
MNRRLVAIVLSGLAVLPASAAPQQARASKVFSRQVVVGTVPTQPASSVIEGVAVYPDRAPVPYATVRLRNLTTGEIEQVTTANYNGEFSFFAEPNVSYVAEIVDDAGRVLATGAIAAGQAGRTAALMIVLPRTSSIAALFGNVAGAIVSAAAGIGITAVTATEPPESPEK